MTCENFAPLEAHVHPLKIVILCHIVPIKNSLCRSNRISTYGMMTCEFFAPCKPTFPLWNLSFSVASPPSLLARNMITWWHDDMMSPPSPARPPSTSDFPKFFKGSGNFLYSKYYYYKGATRGSKGPILRALRGDIGSDAIWVHFTLLKATNGPF